MLVRTLGAVSCIVGRVFPSVFAAGSTTPLPKALGVEFGRACVLEDVLLVLLVV